MTVKLFSLKKQRGHRKKCRKRRSCVKPIIKKKDHVTFLVIVIFVIVSPLTFVISDFFPHSKYILVFIRNHQRFFRELVGITLLCSFFSPSYSVISDTNLCEHSFCPSRGLCPPHPAPSPQRSLSEPHSSLSLESSSSSQLS